MLLGVRRFAVVLGISLALFVAAAACGGGASRGQKEGRTPAGGRVSCTKDADCVITTQSGCCGPCAEQPFSVPADVETQRQNRCAATECAPPPAGVRCRGVDQPEGFVARCKDGTCAAVKI